MATARFRSRLGDHENLEPPEPGCPDRVRFVVPPASRLELVCGISMVRRRSLRQWQNPAGDSLRDCSRDSAPAGSPAPGWCQPVATDHPGDSDHSVATHTDYSLKADCTHPAS